MSWKARTIQGTSYSFRHLEPFTFGLNGLRIRVSLGAHAFTREVKPGDAPQLLFMDGNSARTFCTTRYGHSLHLPAAIMAGAAAYVFTNHKKFVFKQSLPGVPGSYVIAFEMRKSASPKYDIKMQIVSAHHRPSAAKMPRCLFDDAAQAVLNGNPVPWIKK